MAADPRVKAKSRPLPWARLHSPFTRVKIVAQLARAPVSKTGLGVRVRLPPANKIKTYAKRGETGTHKRYQLTNTAGQSERAPRTAAVAGANGFVAPTRIVRCLPLEVVGLSIYRQPWGLHVEIVSVGFAALSMGRCASSSDKITGNLTSRQYS